MPTNDTETWAGLLDFLRPKGPTEWLEHNAPKAPSHLVAQEEIKKEDVKGILQEVGMTKEEFIELALSQPDLWDEDEKYYMEAVLDGSEDDHLLEQLAHQYFSGARQPKKKEEPPPPPPKEDRLDLSLVPPDLPDRVSTIPDLDVLEGTMDVGKWWEKKPGPSRG